MARVLCLLSLGVVCQSLNFARSDEATPLIVEEKHPVISLPGRLDSIEVFNSNSPEIVKNEGILLSTFPGDGKSYPDAHLNHQLRGRVDFFLHHINNRIAQADTKTLHLGLLIKNASAEPAAIDILSGASYLSQPDSPFIALPAAVQNDDGKVFAGPGDRVSLDLMYDRLDSKYFPAKVNVAPGQYAMLFQAPVPVIGLQPALNGRTALFKIKTDQPLYACLLAKLDDSIDSASTLESWVKLLDTTNLVQPREKPATALGATPMIYGRVSGIARGSTWNADVENNRPAHTLDLKAGSVLSVVIDTVANGTYGTKQIQSAPMLLRYCDTAYAAHGNYGIWYKLHLPMVNADNVPVSIKVSFDTPLKNNVDKDMLHFYDPPATQVYFRGTIRVEESNSSAFQPSAAHAVHLVEHRGERGQPLCEFNLEPKQRRDVKLDFIYPADCTPPHVVTVRAQAAEPDAQKRL
jgi:hypothetical protein